ncbi:DUF1592 domain-containing protein [Rubripirellula amarantea]|nr:DUF1592 domain-containing protein [Rubripirellula amarantea]
MANESESNLIATSESWEKQGWPLLERFCLDCHNEDIAEGELDLSSYSSLEVMEGGAGTMQRVLEMIRFGAMPPEDAEVPTDEERKLLSDSLDQTLYAVSCDLRPRPGRVTARRLNRAEYNRTVSDLFGMKLTPADSFPSDEVGAGFDNNSDVLSLSPLQIEKYISAAEEVAATVLVDPGTLPRVELIRPSDQLLTVGPIGVGSFNGLFIKPETIAWAEYEVPTDGRYRIRFYGGSATKDARTVAVFDKSGKLLQRAELEYFGGGGSSKRFDFEIDLVKGKHQFFVRAADESDQKAEVGESVRPERIALSDDQLADAIERSKHPLKRTRKLDADAFALVIRNLQLSGPVRTPEGALPPSQYRILRKTAKKRGDKWKDVAPAAEQCMKPLMRLAFRRPVTDDEVQPYVNLVVEATDRGESYYRGVQIAVTAVLMSPHFLFRIEVPPSDWVADEESGNEVPLTQLQLASRMSYFLWSSMPDEELLKLAEQGRLEGTTLKHQINRMLRHEKADALSTQFASQWLGLRNLTSHEADTDRFPAFTPSLKSAMLRETQMLFSQLVKDNRPVGDLLTADYTFVNQELAKHYELNEAANELSSAADHFQKVSIKNTPRRGVLSHASVLTLTSNPGRTSPVKRGKWILENVLGTPPPDPPAGVPELDETKTADADATLREQLELHRADASCAACHRVMDQLGFGLEQFDAIGQLRTMDGKHKVDSSGELPGGRLFDGASELTTVLGATESKAFATNVTKQLMAFSLGRGLSPQDRCVIDAIVQSTSSNDYRFQDIITEVILSRPFQFYEWNGPSTVQSTEGK